MRAAAKASAIRRLTVRWFGVSSSGAKKTPSTRRATHCWQASQASSSRVAAVLAPVVHSSACDCASGASSIPR